MDSIQQNFDEWREISKHLKKSSLTMMYFIILWSILLCASILTLLFNPKLATSLFFYIIILFLAICLNNLMNQLKRNRQKKYYQILERLDEVMKAILEDVAAAGNRNYFFIFSEYASFMGLKKKMNEADTHKRIKALPGYKTYPKEKFEDIARLYVSIAKIIDQGKEKREQNFLKKAKEGR